MDKLKFPSGLYGITAEKFSKGRSNINVVEQMIEGGISLIQYREKRPHKSFKEMLAECHAIRRLISDAGVLFLVNDYLDIAQLVDADGVHVGQDDLPVASVRKLIGPNKLIGLSTHSPAQAAEAVTAGADYIGVGPIFATNTKDDVCAPVGLGCLDHLVQTCPLLLSRSAVSRNITSVLCWNTVQKPFVLLPKSSVPWTSEKLYGGCRASVAAKSRYITQTYPRRRINNGQPHPNSCCSPRHSHPTNETGSRR